MRGSCRRRHLVALHDPSCIRRAMKKSLPHGLPFAPTKVGVLIDIDMGTKEDFLATLRMGFEEAHEEGVVTRAVALVVKEAIGLPRLEAKNTIDGYHELVAAGVLCVIGPLITDNSLALAPVIERSGVEYASSFRWYAARAELDVLIEAYTSQVPEDLEGVLRKIRDQKPDCLA